MYSFLLMNSLLIKLAYLLKLIPLITVISDMGDDIPSGRVTVQMQYLDAYLPYCAD